MKDMNLLTRQEIVEEFEWSTKLIDKYLKPAKRKYNHYYPGRPVKLYRIDDVVNAMSIPGFATDYEALQRRREKRRERMNSHEDH